jgi:hypothetical protein
MQKRPYSLPCSPGFWLDWLWLDGLWLDGQYRELNPVNQKTVISWVSTHPLLNEAKKWTYQRHDFIQLFLLR